MPEYFNGCTVPELVDKKGELVCDNSFCSEIKCSDCINYPSIVVMMVRETYLVETNKDEYISEGIERISDGD